MQDIQAMRHALGLARRGWGRVHPNPLVGAVLLKDGQVLAEGWHAEYGGPHAEVVALQEAGERGRGGTLVVTLEPCRHHGKQPPCVEAILAAGIRRVVYGEADPSPEAGGGARVLADAGIEVATLPVGQDVIDQNAAFFHRHRTAARPWVALKLATSVDGKVADYVGRSRWISGPEAREWVHWLRAGFDAIGIGGRTARTDNPSLVVRGALRPRVTPRRVIFDRRGNITGADRLLATARETPVTLICESRPEAEAAARLAEAGVEVVVGSGLGAALAALRASGVQSLLVEGGGRLAGHLLAEGLVDRYYWVQSPLWLGEDGFPAFAGLPSALLEQAGRWRVIEHRSLGQDALLVLAPGDRQQESGS